MRAERKTSAVGKFRVNICIKKKKKKLRIEKKNNWKTLKFRENSKEKKIGSIFFQAAERFGFVFFNKLIELSKFYCRFKLANFSNK